MMTKPDRPKCSTSRSATMRAMISPEFAGVLSAAVAQRQDELAEAGHFTQEAGVIIVEKAMASFSS